MSKKPRFTKGEWLPSFNHRLDVSPDFSHYGLKKGDIQAIFDIAHQTLEEVMRVVPDDLIVELPAMIPLYSGQMQGAHANVELGLVQYKHIPGTDCAYEQTIPDILGITINHLDPEKMNEQPFLECLRGSIRHELLHIVAHRAVNVNLRSITESIVARLEKQCFGKVHAYDEHHQSDDMDYKVNFSAIGFRSPDGTQILYDDLSTEMLYQAAHQSLEQLESDELWEIVRRLVAVAAAKNMYPLYSDIRKAMQDVLSREKTEIIEDTPAFREMVEGTHAMAVDYGKAIGFWCASIQDRRIDLMPNGFQPYRFSVTQLPSVGFMEWQTYAQSGNDREFGGYVLDLKSPFLVSPKRLIEMQMRQYGIAAHKHIDRIQFSLYEQEKSPQPFFECEIPNPLGII